MCTPPGGNMEGWNSSTLPYSLRGTLPCREGEGGEHREEVRR